MSAPEPPGAGAAPEVVPGEVLAVAGRVDGLHDGVVAARDALRGLAGEPLPVGTGQDNAAIAAWYRSLLDTDTAPAAAALAADLDAVRGALRRDVAAWEAGDRAGAGAIGATGVAGQAGGAGASGAAPPSTSPPVSPPPAGPGVAGPS